MRPVHLVAALGAVTALLACGDAPPAAPDRIDEAPLAVSADLRAALADAETRLLPALDDAAPVRATLAELRAALDAGDRARVRGVVAAARDRLAAHAPESGADGDAADVAALALLVNLVGGAAEAPAAR